MKDIAWLVFVVGVALTVDWHHHGIQGCEMPTVNDTNCDGLIIDCEDQSEEVQQPRGETLTCLELNTMEQADFFDATESCDVLNTCACTVAYYLFCEYDPDEFSFVPPP